MLTESQKKYIQLDSVKARVESESAVHVSTEKCDKHGTYKTDDRHPGTGECPDCKAEREAVELQSRAIANRNNRVKASGLPLRFLDRTFENYKITSQRQQQVIGSVMEYARDEDALSNGRSMIMFGSVGVGKTHLAAATINEVIKPDNRVDAIYTTARDLIRNVRATWKNPELDEGEAIDRFSDVSLLVIDEVGVQFGSESEAILMFEVIDKRYGNRLPTVFISNLSLPEIKTILTDRVIDRLREDNGLVVELRWDSNRGAV